MKRRDRGSVTLEMAIALPAAVLLITMGVGAIVLAAHKLACEARARDTALAAARGEEVPLPGGGRRHSVSVSYADNGTVTAAVTTTFTSCTNTMAMEP